MKAHLLNSYGPDSLALGEVEEPATAAGQVKVSVEAIGINPLDWKISNGYLAEMMPLPLPAVIGTDIAGTVLEVGAGVEGFKAGDRVVGFADSGAFAQNAVTRANRLTVIPDGLTSEQAVTLATSGETSQRGLSLLAPAPASTIVVNGAAGAVGSAVVQILVADGHTVIGTASPDNHDYLRSLGATPVTYGETMLEDIAAAAPQGVDAAFDTAAQNFIGRVNGLIPASRIVTISDFAAGAQGAIVAGGDPTALTAETLPPVLDLAARGAFRTEITELFPFEQVSQALALSQGGHLRGKIVVTGAGRA
jgi:NADPH:quinone reductase-like Zn-dependent oxidoreductase